MAGQTEQFAFIVPLHQRRRQGRVLQRAAARMDVVETFDETQPASKCQDGQDVLIL